MKAGGPGSARALGTGEEVIDALAVAVAERLARPVDEAAVVAVDAATVATRIGASAAWVREHFRELGGWRLGEGPKAPYRFDLATAERAVRGFGRESGSLEAQSSKRRTRARNPGRASRLVPIRGSDPT